MKRILVIRLGALGDLVFCFQTFHEIRHTYPDADIALLTRAPFADFARSLPYFDHVIVDTHPTIFSPRDWFRLRKDLIDFSPDIVFDLQGKFRQTVLYALLGGPFGPVWSGAAPFCKFPRPWPPRAGMNFADFLGAQLRAAGIPATLPPDLRWLDAPIQKFSLPSRYAVLIPGCSPKAPHKRWPPKKYAALAKMLRSKGVACVAVGTVSDAEAISVIKIFVPEVVDVSGKTTLFELAGILRRAHLVVGNDTGPLHLAAALGTPTVALFSGKSNPIWSKPPGPKVAWRQSENLADLSVANAVSAIDELRR